MIYQEDQINMLHIERHTPHPRTFQPIIKITRFNYKNTGIKCSAHYNYTCEEKGHKITEVSEMSGYFLSLKQIIVQQSKSNT